MNTSSITIVADYRAAVKAKIREAGAAALKEAADELLRVATLDVPVSPSPGGGYLRDCGFSEVDEAALRAQVAYDKGPPDKPSLPVWVHEDTTTRAGDPIQHSTGHAKWLEMAAKETAERLGVVIGMSIKKKMR